MNIAEWSIRKSVITWVTTILLLWVGWTSFNSLSRLEDPEFTIKDAVIMTPYPGASARSGRPRTTPHFRATCSIAWCTRPQPEEP